MKRASTYSLVASLGAALALALAPQIAAAQTAGSRASGPAPAHAAIICKDGTTWTGKSGRGACRGHHGIDKAKTRAAEEAAGAPTSPPTAITAPPQSQPQSTGRSRMAQAGGGADQVWVNIPSKVYHCPGTRWYGKTKHGEYMTEAQAQAQGDRPDHGKPCR